MELPTNSKSMNLKHLLSLCSIIFITSCATPYQPYGITGGYKETPLAPDVVRISVEGNGYTSRDRVQDFALLRAAEIALQSGYPYFVVINERNDTSTGSFTTAGSSYTSGSVYGVGNSAYYSGTTTYVPGQTITFQFPETGILVKFMKKKSKDALVFDANFLSTTLRQKYKIER
jgi:hypothetical protein